MKSLSSVGLLFIPVLAACSLENLAGTSNLATGGGRPLHENADLKIETTKDKLTITVKKNSNARVIFDAMVANAETKDGVTTKVLETTQNPGGQKMKLTCTSSAQTICELSVDKWSQSKKAYRMHEAKNDANYLVIRNDTDYSDPAQVIFDQFAGQPLSSVTAGTDPFAGVSVIGGEGLYVPSEFADGVLQIQCARDTTQKKYFCEFIVKNPWPKDIDLSSASSGGGGEPPGSGGDDDSKCGPWFDTCTRSHQETYCARTETRCYEVPIGNTGQYERRCSNDCVSWQTRTVCDEYTKARFCP